MIILRLKKDQFLLTVLSVIFSTSLAFGQTVFKGKVEGPIQLDSIEFKFAGDILGMGRVFSQAKTYQVKLDSGNFSFQLPQTSDFSYLLILNPNTSLNVTKLFIPISQRPFLIGKGDTLDITISQNGVISSNSSTPAMRLQMETLAINERYGEKMIQLARDFNPLDTVGLAARTAPYLIKRGELYGLWEKELMDNVDNYSNQMDSGYAQLIKYEHMGMVRNHELSMFRFMMDLAPDVVHPITSRQYLDQLIDTEDRQARLYEGGSPEFASYLNMKVVTDLLAAFNLIEGKVSIEIPTVLDIIGRRYQGKTYDEVAFSAFLDRGSRKYLDQKTYSILTSRIQDPLRKEFIIKQWSKTASEQEFFKFELINHEGSKVTNSDFAGKVVVYDFWYTGCIACAQLHRAMAPVKERFRNNPNVKFVNISVDLSQQRWLESVQSGLYSDKDDVSLWVGKNGEHPIITELGINSYPTQVIVDARNRIVMMNPPDVRIKSELEGFIGVVERAVNQ